MRIRVIWVEQEEAEVEVDMWGMMGCGIVGCMRSRSWGCSISDP